MKIYKPMKYIGIIFTILITLCIAIVSIGSWNTESDIKNYMQATRTIGKTHPSPQWDDEAIKKLPPVVQKYFKFTFPTPPTSYHHVEVEAEGMFRLPLRTSFAPTTAQQVITVGEPNLVFAAKTPVTIFLWARAYDAYINGDMDMRAKILSTFTVVTEQSPELNQTSLQRWLLESPLYPMALLPGGSVTWEGIDANRAKAIVAHKNIRAELIATFREDGSLQQFDAISDGDLTTPYHGSGEHVLREDYKLVQGMQIPHKFTIARQAKDTLYPFWKGTITAIRYF